MADPIPNQNTRKIFRALKRCASQMHTVNYKALAAEASVAWSRRAMSLHLKHIRDEICIARKLPLLNELAVNKQTWLPGESVLPKTYKIPVSAQRTTWRGVVLQVLVYPWETVKFDAGE